ncbi:MAG: stage III sporulation protein AB [Clostridia bacterium]|nr:stage III sporulation protein AB [Clostridia bacterium]
MIKILGCVLILIASVVSGYYFEWSFKEKIQFLENVVGLLNYIKKQIEFFSTPIKEIYSSYPDKSKHITDLIDGDLDDLRRKYKDLDFIFNYFQQAGKGYKSEQLKLCDYTINEAQACLNKLKEELPKKVKVIRSISLFLGASIVILLI